MKDMQGPGENIICTQRNKKIFILAALEVFLCIDNILLQGMDRSSIFTIFALLWGVIAILSIFTAVNCRLVVDQATITMWDTYRRKQVIPINTITDMKITRILGKNAYTVSLSQGSYHVVTVPYFSKGYDHFLGWVSWEMDKKEKQSDK